MTNHKNKSKTKAVKAIRELLEKITKDLNPPKGATGPGDHHFHPDSRGTNIYIGNAKNVVDGTVLGPYIEPARKSLKRYIAIATDLRLEWPELPSLKEVIKEAKRGERGAETGLQLLQQWCVESLKILDDTDKPHKKKVKRGRPAIYTRNEIIRMEETYHQHYKNHIPTGEAWQKVAEMFSVPRGKSPDGKAARRLVEYHSKNQHIKHK